MWKYACGGMRGRPPIAHKILVRGQHLSAIAMMSTVGVLNCTVVTGGVTGDTFYHFVQQCILPHLLPFNGRNPHSIRPVFDSNCP